MKIGQGASTVRVVVDARGNSLILWGHHGTFSIRSFSHSGGLGAAQVVWPRAMGSVGGEAGADLYGSSTGYALMTWSRARDGAFFVRTRSAAGVLGPLDHLTAPAGGQDLTLLDGVVAPNGTATVLFTVTMHATPASGQPYYFQALYVAQVLANGSVKPPVLVDQGDQSTGIEPANPQKGLLGADTSGNVHIIWLRFPADGESCCNQLWTRSLSPDGALGPAVAVSPGTTNVGDSGGDGYQLVVGSDGSLTFVWQRIFDQRTAHFQEDIEARRESSTGALGPVETLSPMFTSNDMRTAQGGQPSGVELEQLFLSPLGPGAAVAYVTATQNCRAKSCTSPTRYAFVERNVTASGAAAPHLLVRSTSADDDGRKPPGSAIAWTGEFFGAGPAALAIWQTRIPLPGARIGMGLDTRTVSTAGRIGHPSTPFAAGTLNFSYADYSAAVGASGREVVAGVTARHGLEARARG